MKLKKNSALANAGWLIAGKLAQSVLGFVITVFTSRFLGPSNYGLISYAMSLAQFVLPIVQLGLNAVLVYEIVNSSDKEGEILGTARVLNLCSSVLCILGIVAFTAIANRGETETLIVCVLYSVSLIFSAIEMIVYWFQAKYLSKYAAIVSFVGYALTAVYRVFLLVTQKSVFWFAVSNSLDLIIICTLLYIIYRKNGGQKFRFSYSTAKRLLSSGKYFVLSGIMVMIFGQTDKIMLKFMCGNVEVGYYSVAITCACLLSFVFSAIVNAFRPYILEKKKASIEGYEDGVIKLYAVVNYLAIAQSVFFFVFARPIVTVIYGEQYLNAIPIMRIIVWYATFSYFGAAKDVWILAESKQKYLLFLNAGGALTNIILNFIFIPLWEGTGAAIASLITQVITNVGMCIILEPLRRNAYLFFCSLNPKVILNMLKKYLKP